MSSDGLYSSHVCIDSVSVDSDSDLISYTDDELSS